MYLDELYCLAQQVARYEGAQVILAASGCAACTRRVSSALRSPERGLAMRRQAWEYKRLRRAEIPV